jgi:hypothetical protein
MALTLDGSLGETLPSWTTAGRPASPTTGLTGYNTTLNIREVWNGSAWTADSLPAAGTSGNVLTSNGTNWTSGASAGGQIQTQVFTAPGTFTSPSTTTSIRVTVVGGGGGSSGPGAPAAGDTGGSSSFGSLVSATGGGGAPTGASPVNGTPGTGTVSSGTTIVNNNVGNRSITANISTYVSGAFVGGSVSNGNAAVAYSTTNRDNGAGACGNSPNLGGAGGLAVALVPITASTPYAVTVGSGGAAPAVSRNGAVGGVVVVEYVG